MSNATSNAEHENPWEAFWDLVALKSVGSRVVLHHKFHGNSYSVLILSLLTYIYIRSNVQWFGHCHDQPCSRSIDRFLACSCQTLNSLHDIQAQVR